MIKLIEGNILDSKEDIIVQQVNCMGKMGSGLAKQIRDKYPIVYEKYAKYCSCSSPWDLMGNCLVVKCPDGKYIANLFGQRQYGNDGKKYTEIDELENAMWSLRSAAEMFGYSVAVPEGIGCGLGGEDWKVVERMIDNVFRSYEVTLYRFKQ